MAGRGSPPHGTRARYIAGCHCPACGRANRRYLDDYKADRRIDGRRTIPAWAVVCHLQKLRASGVELVAVARLSGFSVHHLRAVARGDYHHVTRRLHDGVMAVRPGDYSENGRVPAAAAVEILDELERVGIKASDVARALGYRYPHMSIRHHRRFVTQRTYRRLLVIAAAAGVRRTIEVLEVVA